MTREKIKQHFREHKELYIGIGIGLGVAGITYAVMRGRNVGVHCVPNGLETVTVRPLSFLSKQNVVTVIGREGTGPPSWVIRCIETGEFFISQSAASREMNIPKSIISSHLNGQFEHALGYHFERICMAA